MSKKIEDTARLGLWSLWTFITTFAMLHFFGVTNMVYKPNSSMPASAVSARVIDALEVEQAKRIKIDKIFVDALIINPNSSKVGVLDAALLKGVVHYPGSGNPGEEKNMFLFGHSSRRQNVSNPAYKSFNGLKNLRRGDEVKVYTNSSVYTYRISKVEVVDKNRALVEFGNQRKLTLSTCDTFGKKSDRVVVEADFIDAKKI